MKKFATTLALILLSPLCLAISLDKSGIIDLTNEGTIRGSCIVVGRVLKNATMKASHEMTKARNQAGKSQDERWQTEQTAKNYREYGELGPLMAESLQKDYARYVPPSQLEDFRAQNRATALRIKEQNNPQKTIEAFNYCAKNYKFFRN